jgi:hypothetical protein
LLARPARNWSETVLARFRRVAGIDGGRASTSRLPRPFLERPSLSPQQLLSRLPLGRRTTNALRRHIACAPEETTWTYGRLMAIKGFGVRALVEVLEGLQAEPAPGPREAEPSLEHELARLVSASARTSPTPVFDCAIALIAASLPASEREIRRRLRSAGLVRDNNVELLEIERASRFATSSIPFAVVRREGIVVAVPPDRAALARTVCDLAGRALLNWGVANMEYLCFYARTEETALVSKVLEAHVAFQWLDAKLGWFWYRTCRSRLILTIERILSFAGTVRLTDLAQTLFRRRPPALIPPVRVLARLCRECPQFVVDRQRIRLDRPDAAESRLTEAETGVIELFRDRGPRIDLRRQPLNDQFGPDGGEILRRLRASRFVLEPTPGVFRLIGAEPRWQILQREFSASSLPRNQRETRPR